MVTFPDWDKLRYQEPVSLYTNNSCIHYWATVFDRCTAHVHYNISLYDILFKMDDSGTAEIEHCVQIVFNLYHWHQTHCSKFMILATRRSNIVFQMHNSAVFIINMFWMYEGTSKLFHPYGFLLLTSKIVNLCVCIHVSNVSHTQYLCSSLLRRAGSTLVPQLGARGRGYRINIHIKIGININIKA